VIKAPFFTLSLILPHRGEEIVVNQNFSIHGESFGASPQDKSIQDESITYMKLSNLN